jgi:DNA-binding NarL/FixJ family response regulator
LSPRLVPGKWPPLGFHPISRSEVIAVAVTATAFSSAERIEIFISACDPVSREGIVGQLRGHPIYSVEERDLHPRVVGLVVVDEIDEETARQIRSLKQNGLERVVVMATRLEDGGLIAAVEAGACGFLRRGQSTAARLLDTIRAAAAGDGALPPDLIGRLMDQVGRLQRQILNPRGPTFTGLTEREIKVLKLLAEGLDTGEVGRQLFLSERTVKNIVHDMTSRLNLRNRTHAVAYALRQGLI